VATGDEADELLRTLWDSTYVLRSPLQGNDVYDLWMVIAWRKCYLEKKAKEAAGRRVVPAAVQAYMAGGSTSTSTTVDEDREDEDRIHFKVVGAGRRCRKRKSSCNTGAASSSGTSVAGTVHLLIEEPHSYLFCLMLTEDRNGWFFSLSIMYDISIPHQYLCSRSMYNDKSLFNLIVWYFLYCKL
jgi:hypothetical protein